eukprot:Clim_evm26s161 gene=Clim_evmTU26s161
MEPQTWSSFLSNGAQWPLGVEILGLAPRPFKLGSGAYPTWMAAILTARLPFLCMSNEPVRDTAVMGAGIGVRHEEGAFTLSFLTSAGPTAAQVASVVGSAPESAGDVPSAKGVLCFLGVGMSVGADEQHGCGYLSEKRLAPRGAGTSVSTVNEASEVDLRSVDGLTSHLVLMGSPVRERLTIEYAIDTYQRRSTALDNVQSIVQTQGFPSVLGWVSQSVHAGLRLTKAISVGLGASATSVMTAGTAQVLSSEDHPVIPFINAEYRTRRLTVFGAGTVDGEIMMNVQTQQQRRTVLSFLRRHSDGTVAVGFGIGSRKSGFFSEAFVSGPCAGSSRVMFKSSHSISSWFGLILCDLSVIYRIQNATGSLKTLVQFTCGDS